MNGAVGHFALSWQNNFVTKSMKLMLLGYLDDNRSVDLFIIMDIPAFDMWSDGGSNSCSLWQYYDNNLFMTPDICSVVEI